MAVFKGTIRLEDGDGLETNLTVDAGRLLVTAGQHEIGNWAIEELTAVRQNGEFRLSVEEDELEVGVVDPVGFSEALGIKENERKPRRAKKPRVGRRSKREEPSPSEEAPQPATLVVQAPVPPTESAPAPVQSIDQSDEEEPSWWARLSARSKMIGAGVVGLAVLGVIAPNLLALLLMLTGLATLFLAIAAKGEGGTGFHPPAFFATDVAVASGIGMVLMAVVIMMIT